MGGDGRGGVEAVAWGPVGAREEGCFVSVFTVRGLGFASFVFVFTVGCVVGLLSGGVLKDFFEMYS